MSADIDILDDEPAFKAYVMERSRDPSEVPSARQRALMACLAIPSPVQKWMMDIGAIEPLLDSLEATILAAEKHARETLNKGHIVSVAETVAP